MAVGHHYRRYWHTNVLLASEQDSIRGNTIENQGYLYVYICVCVCGHTYVILYFDPRIFVFASCSTPTHTSTKQNISV